ncbi:MAG: transcription antitermination factor NusB [Pseudomonadales bacterium]|nr:transcription antitermination factor NusB [Pseudomonadales bacterium]
MPATTPVKPRTAQRRKARTLLLQACYQWQLSAAAPSAIEAQYRADNPGKVDWDFFHQVLTGVTGGAAQLDALLSPLLDRKFSDLNPVELAILRLGCYELSERIDIPYRVVINECVELARTFGASESHKYINGVLDQAARQLRRVEINAPA